MTTTIAPSTLLPRDILRVGSFGLRTRRLRAALSALGIAIGIAAMVAVLGISDSSKAQLLAQLDRLGTNLLTVTPGQTLLGDDATLPKDSPQMIARIGPVGHATPVARLRGAVRRNDHIAVGETEGISIIAARLDLLRTLSGTTATGRYLNAATSRYPTVVLGATAARRLGIDRPGVRLWLADHWFTVIGILDPLPLAPELDPTALVGYPIAETLLGFDGHPTTVYLRADPASIDDVRAVAAATANPHHPEQVRVSRPSDVLAARAATASAFTTLLLALGSVALIVGGVGIANVMVIAVLERRSEIGLRRALGATRVHIALQFVTEALLLSSFGGAGGVLLGSAATMTYATTRSWPTHVPSVAIFGGLAAAIITGIAAGTYPAVTAANLPPTDALRTA